MADDEIPEIEIPDAPTQDDVIFGLLDSDQTPIGDIVEEETPEEEPAPAEAVEPPQAETGEGGGPPSAPSPGMESEDFAAIWRDTFGVDPTADAVAQNFAIAKQIADLTPEQRARMVDAINGQQYQQPPTMPQQYQAPVPVVEPPVQFAPLPEYLDDDVRQAIEAERAAFTAAQQQTQQQIAALQQAEMERQRVALEQQNAAIQLAAAEARQEFAEQYPGLTEGDTARILRTAGTFDMTAVLQATGDPKVACRSVLSQALAAHPDIQSRLDEARIQAAVDVATADRERKSKAGAVSGGSTAAHNAPSTPSREDAIRFLQENPLQG